MFWDNVAGIYDIFVNIINVVGNYLLINPHHTITIGSFSMPMIGAVMGVRGAALSTGISWLVGGLWLDEPAMDLPVALALISGLKDVTVASDTVAFGEIGLTGEIRSVVGTPFDFREPKTIGEDFDLEHPDMKLAGGFDHCLCFTGGETKTPVLRIEAYEPNSGRLMQVYTNQPCVQFYTGNFMWEIEAPLKGGYPASVQAAFCLETQKIPDAINHANFNDTILNPGEKYDYTTIYQFSTK